MPLFLQIAAREIGGDKARMQRLLAAVTRYQQTAWMRSDASYATIAEIGSARLIDYGGNGRPVMFVPSLVNPPYILDLIPGRSMLHWLKNHGIRPFLLDWGTPDKDEEGFSVADYVTARLLTMIEAIGTPIDLVGYCLGGTMTIAAAHHPSVERLVTIAAPWHFSGYDDTRRAELSAYWQAASKIATTLGKMPMDLIQPAFWSLDPAAAVRKFEQFARFPSESQKAQVFVAVEDWANTGPALALPAARECFEDFYSSDLTGKGAWLVDGHPVNPTDMTKPFLNIISTTDRIVPAAAAPDAGKQLHIAAGHVGMVIGSSAEKQLWQPLADWLNG